MSASSYSSKTSNVDRTVPLKIVGSSARTVNVCIRGLKRHVLTGDDRDLAAQVRQTDLGDINPINDDFSFCRFHESEERERERTLSRTGPA